jgi:chromosomal replication initiation ATPase DnaA
MPRSKYLSNSYVPPRVEAVLSLAAQWYNLSVKALRNINLHTDEVVAARRMAARELREMGFSFPQIGRYLGGLHHTSVMNLCTAKKQGKKRYGGRSVTTSTPVDCGNTSPDLSGEWAI